MTKFEIFIREQCKEIWKICGSILRGLIATSIVILLLSLVLGYYNVSVIKSFQEKVLKNFIVLNMPPRVRTFTFYGTEFGLKTSGVPEFIQEKAVLKSKKEQSLFFGVWNDEGRNLNHVNFVIFIPKGVKVVNKNETLIPVAPWIEMLPDQQYEYFDVVPLGPGRGRMFHPTLRVEFPGQGVYLFQYQVLCDDFLPAKGSFFLKVE